MILKLLLVVLFAVVVNLPLGYWRKGLRKFTFTWWLAIHLSIPFVIALRYSIGLPYSAAPLVVTAPVIIASAVAGQWIGGRFRKKPSADHARVS